MASDVSTYLGNKQLRWLLGNAMPTAPTTLYVALYDGNPKSGGTEVTASIRAAGRVALSMPAPASGTTNTASSDADTDFGSSDGDVDVSHFAICDAASSGNILMSEALPGGPFSITTGQPVKFPSGDITITLGT